jgi:hypothetical protein
MTVRGYVKRAIFDVFMVHRVGLGVLFLIATQLFSLRGSGRLDTRLDTVRLLN